MNKPKRSTEWNGDLKYIAQRNTLIPIAAKHADKMTKKWGLTSITDWCKLYHREMNRLAHERLGCLL